MDVGRCCIERHSCDPNTPVDKGVLSIEIMRCPD